MRHEAQSLRMEKQALEARAKSLEGGAAVRAASLDAHSEVASLVAAQVAKLQAKWQEEAAALRRSNAEVQKQLQSTWAQLEKGQMV